ncbi:Kinesin-like protein KIF18A [Holothuria leucospilota]|uniref:Kinesin-like protein KIF18A n=1 Tax=Holothuria leucospilota TaxID=206669 RepID=A0A9Q0YJJ8_HOLLE|nr:Kinesin-like protein KIF18A [Holothuria leucospilota]
MPARRQSFRTPRGNRKHSNGGSPGVSQSEVEDTNSNVRVVVRVRPLNAQEVEKNSSSIIHVLDENVLIFDPKSEDSPNNFYRGKRVRHRNLLQKKSRDMRFAFDHIFDANSSQEYVYEKTTKSIVDSILNGFNASVFAYGATGAGKTHTMLGGPDSPGVIFLTMLELYEKINAIQSEKTCNVTVSYLEVYNETIRDLIKPSGPLAVREDPQKGVLVSGLSVHKPKSAEELFQMLEFGNQNRTQHPTDANKQSSRSHAVFQVFVRQKDRTAGLKTDVRLAKMSLIDLAGSERATVTTNRGARFREGANINKSLLALGNCINALAEAKSKGHVPYRNSKLTRLLKDSLGGNCKTVMIAAVSPSNLTYEDTYNTLKYANRTKDIKTSLKRNVVSVNFHVTKYAKIVEELRAEVTELKAKLRNQESQVSLATPAIYQPDEKTLRFQVQIQQIFSQRASIRKELLELESSDRSLTAKILRKEMLTERVQMIHGSNCLGEKTLSKFEKVIATTRKRQHRLKDRKAAVELRSQENEAALQRLKTEASDGSFLPDVLQENLRAREMEIEIRDSRRLIKHIRRFARNQESHIQSSEKLIGTLLSVVRRQFYLIKGSGLVTDEITQEFEGIQRQVEGNREVAWADQSVLEDSDRVNTSTDQQSGDGSLNYLLNLPVYRCEIGTPKVQPPKNHRRLSYSKTGNSPHYSPHPRRANHPGISPDETASPSPPVPFVTPVFDPSGEVPKTNSGVPSSTNQIEQQGKHSLPVADSREVHTSSMPPSVGTPASHGNGKESHMPRRVPKRSPMVRRGTFGTPQSIRTPPQRVATVTTPPVRIPIRNLKGTEVKSKAQERLSCIEEDEIPKMEEMTSSPTNDSVEKTLEGQNNFKISPVTGKTLTFAEVVSTPTSLIPVKNSHRNPFATLSTNSPTLGRTSLPVGDPKMIEDIVKIGYSNKKTPQHGKVKRVAKENTVRKPLHHPYHRRSKSQGSNLITRENIRNSEYLHKYGLPSILDQMPSVKQSRQVPAYMSMTKSAASKRKHAPERRRYGPKNTHYQTEGKHARSWKTTQDFGQIQHHEYLAKYYVWQLEVVAI